LCEQKKNLRIAKTIFKQISGKPKLSKEDIALLNSIQNPLVLVILNSMIIEDISRSFNGKNL